jgi:hypothetical protein
MAEYNIYAGLGGSFGGSKYIETLEFDSEDEAIDYAYEIACEKFEQYAGLHGLTSYKKIKEDNPDLSENEIEELYNEERERWLSYKIEEV